MLDWLLNEVRRKNILVPDGMSKEQAQKARNIVNQQGLPKLVDSQAVQGHRRV
jgi:hypothetical protein